MQSTNADTKEWQCVEFTFKSSLSILSQDVLGVRVFRSPAYYFYFCHYLQNFLKLLSHFRFPVYPLGFHFNIVTLYFSACSLPSA